VLQVVKAEQPPAQLSIQEESKKALSALQCKQLMQLGSTHPLCLQQKPLQHTLITWRPAWSGSCLTQAFGRLEM